MDRLLAISRYLVGESHCEEVQQELQQLLDPHGFSWDWKGKEEFVVLVDRGGRLDLYLFQKEQHLNDVITLGSLRYSARLHPGMDVQPRTAMEAFVGL